MDATVAAAIDRALAGYQALADVAESLDEEWPWVADLTGAWRARLAAVAAARGTEQPPVGVSGAIDALAAEAAAVSDPWRAIDWLSTYPQVLLLALGEGT